LIESGEQLEEVITEKTRSNTKKSQMSVVKLSNKTINRDASCIREVDVLKSILLLPGVTNAEKVPQLNVQRRRSKF
jgi:hypothetical protein